MPPFVAFKGESKSFELVRNTSTILFITPTLRHHIYGSILDWLLVLDFELL